MGLFARHFRIQIVSAELEKLLTKLLNENVEMMDIIRLDSLTVEVVIQRKQISDFLGVMRKYEVNYHIISKDGFLWKIFALRKRPVLLAGIVLFVICSLLLPERILFIHVTGNETISDTLILSEAEKMGISFGIKASDVRSEELKNQLLQKIPKLQWVGITTYGSCAVIQVEERSKPAQQITQKEMISSIIASRDGVITQMTVHRGNPICKTGQTVNAGDVLVSGYTDCGIKLKAESAQAEIFAHTIRESLIVSPLTAISRTAVKGKHTCYLIRVGKKVINLCNHSGILDGTCVKMYQEDFLTLPGGFQLPVSLIQVRYEFYECSDFNLQHDDFGWLPQSARTYVCSQMIAGEILSEDIQWNCYDEICVFVGIYSCHEMIGQVKYEEIWEKNAEDN